VECLELEVDLEDGIIGLCTGRFVSHLQNRLSLAVLHCRKISVYDLVPENGAVSLKRMFSHNLGIQGEHFSAFSMVSGSFGGVNGKDFIAVESLDGQVQVFEQEVNAFVCSIGKDCLLPGGPMTYVPRTDSILICTAGMQLVNFKYHNLNSSRLSKDDAKTPDWAFTIGESIIGVFSGRFSSTTPASQVSILVVGERSLFFLDERGGLRTNVKLEVGFHPICCFLSDPDPQGFPNLVVCSDKGVIQIWKDLNMVWGAAFEFCPIGIALCSIEGVDGLLVTMTDLGEVGVQYLGTDKDASLVSSVSGESKIVENRIPYEELDREHAMLLSKIRNLQKSNPKKASSQAKSFRLDISVPGTLDTLNRQDLALVMSENQGGLYATREDGHIIQLTVRLRIENMNRTKMKKNITVNVCLPDGFVASNSNFFFEELMDFSEVEVAIRVKNGMVPPSLVGTVLVTFTETHPPSQIVEQEFRLPLFMVCTPRVPIKNSAAVVTLETGDNEAVRASVLFDEMLRQPGISEELVQSIVSNTSNVLSFQFTDKLSNVTVLASKSGGRFRVQGTSLGHLWLVFEDLQLRLATRSPETLFSFSEELPLQNLFQTIQCLHESKKSIKLSTAALNDQSYQYRLVQKILLANYKDKNASSLQGLDSLLYITHDQIMNTIASLEDEKVGLESIICLLSASIRLVLHLAKLKYPDLSFDDMQVLKSALSPEVHDEWEINVESAITHLLKTTLAKTPKAIVQGNSPANVVDVHKLKKHIAILFDRLSKGAKPGFKELLTAETKS